MTRRKKLLVGAACVLGAFVVLVPLFISESRLIPFPLPGGDSDAERALRPFIERTRHRTVKNAVCTHNEDQGKDVYLCVFQYAGHNPVSVPKVACIRVVEAIALSAPCFPDEPAHPE